MSSEALYGLGIALIFVGAFVIMMAIFWLFLSSIKGKGKLKGGGAIIIGPIPIVFGTDKESVKIVLLLSITLTILVIIMMITFHLTTR